MKSADEDKVLILSKSQTFYSQTTTTLLSHHKWRFYSLNLGHPIFCHVFWFLCSSAAPSFSLKSLTSVVPLQSGGGEDGPVVSLFFRIVATSLKRQAKCLYLHTDSSCLRGIVFTRVFLPISQSGYSGGNLSPFAPEAWLGLKLLQSQISCYGKKSSTLAPVCNVLIWSLGALNL